MKSNWIFVALLGLFLGVFVWMVKQGPQRPRATVSGAPVPVGAVRGDHGAPAAAPAGAGLGIDSTGAIADIMSSAQKNVDKYERGSRAAAGSAGQASQLDDH